jgi:hypothetical protein
LHERVRTEETAQKRVVHAAVHVDKAKLLYVLVAAETAVYVIGQIVREYFFAVAPLVIPGTIEVAVVVAAQLLYTAQVVGYG